MGKRGGKRGGGRGRGRGRGGYGNRGLRAPRVDIEKNNELYEKHYNSIIPEEQQNAFWDSLRSELPVSFRFTGSKGHAIPVLNHLKSYYLSHIAAIEHEGKPVQPPSPLPWYPNEMGWQMSTPKQVVRKYQPFSEFKKYLVSETQVGNISRQEVVSMAPPLLMDVKPGMVVLDLCASPGSKTAQLIEMVHGGEEARMRKIAREMRQSEGRAVSPVSDEVKQEIAEEEQGGDWSDDGRSTGLVIANDVDYKRAHLLIHQTKRLNSPNLIVTNHDATMYPSIKITSVPATNGQRSPNKYLKFDRILADVPCSGDGTPRKNHNVWKDWAPMNGIGLHVVQSRILVRALQMLKVGGKVVYSTCSMNPVENEAIVSTAIERCGGLSKVEIMDCSKLLPELKRAPGLNEWQVMDKAGRIWNNWDDVVRQQEEIGIDGLGKLAHTMFPQLVHGQRLPLERCVRVYPHLQDTGGFFITVLEKKSEIRARPEGPAKEESVVETAKTVKTEADLNQRDAVEDNPGPLISIVNEIESKTGGDVDPVSHITAADDFVPPTTEPAEESPSAAMRQNQPNIPTAPVSPQKRALADSVDAMQAAKRVRVAGDGDAAQPGDKAAPAGGEDRMVHWPPPPGAELTEADVTPAKITTNGIPKKKEQPIEESFKYLDPYHTELEGIYKFYGLSERFPRDRFLVRNAEGIPAKTIYYTSSLTKNILQENEGSGIKFVHAGVKAFVKQDVPREDVCRWRIQAEGLPLLERWVSEDRVIKLHRKTTFHLLLKEMFPKIADDDWKKLGEIGERLRDSGMGCFVLRIEKGEGEDAFGERMVLPLWRSIASANLMLPKEERKAMLLRLYNDEAPLQDSSKNVRQEKTEVKVEEMKKEESEEDKEAEPRGNTSSEDDDDDGGVRLQDDPDATGYIQTSAGDVEREAEMEVGLETGAIDEKYVAEQLQKPAS